MKGAQQFYLTCASVLAGFVCQVASFSNVWSPLPPARAFISPTSRDDFINVPQRAVAMLKHCTLLLSASPSEGDTPLCDLQTFLKLAKLVQTGGEAKTLIQGGQCLLNGAPETRRAKKLFAGDKVALLADVDKNGDETLDLDVEGEVNSRGYVYKVKVKKVKTPRDETGDFGGQFRSDEWRAERKLKKYERKKNNEVQE
jgi:ribosome-associated protein